MNYQNRMMKFKDNNHLSIGRLGEYWTKFALTLKGFDVFTSGVENKGIDFIVRVSLDKYLDIQVKSIRFSETNYAFIPKKGEWKETVLRENLILALVIFVEDEPPHLYLIPSTEWRNPNELLRDINYESTEKSISEWGITISMNSIDILESYRFEKQYASLI